MNANPILNIAEREQMTSFVLDAHHRTPGAALRIGEMEQNVIISYGVGHLIMADNDYELVPMDADIKEFIGDTFNNDPLIG